MSYEDVPEKAVFDSQEKEAWRGDHGAMRNQWHLSESQSLWAWMVNRKIGENT